MTGESRVEGAGSWEDALRAPFTALAGGDREALDAIWRLSSRSLYAAALWRTGDPEDAADVVQEVFVKLAARRGELAGVAAPHLWLLAVTHRSAIDATRRRRRRRAEPLDDVPFLIARDSDPERDARAEEMNRALARLPGEQRETVLLHHFTGLSFREIGEALGVPAFTAASRWRLALARLREVLGGRR